MKDKIMIEKSTLLPEQLVFYENRSIYHTSIKPPHAFRILLMGDSYGYGIGIPFRATIGEQLSLILNKSVAIPWVECINISLIGACIFQDMGRILSHGLMLNPDLSVILVCANDAAMLRPLAGNADGDAKVWMHFRAQIKSAMKSFRKDLDNQNAAPCIFAYFDTITSYADVRPPEILAELCNEFGFPFIDFSSLFQKPEPRFYQVSVSDGHLNGTAHKKAAEQLAQIILNDEYLSGADDLSSSNWIETFRDFHIELNRSGLPPLAAALRAKQILMEKWDSEKYCLKQNSMDIYSQIIQTLDREILKHYIPQALAMASRFVRSNHNVDIFMLQRLDKFISWYHALIYALENTVETGKLDQDLNEIRKVINVGTPQMSREQRADPIKALQSLLMSVPETISSNIKTLERISAFIKRHVNDSSPMDIEYLSGLIARLYRYHCIFKQSVERLLKTLTCIDNSSVDRDIRRLVYFFYYHSSAILNLMTLTTHRPFLMAILECDKYPPRNLFNEMYVDISVHKDALKKKGLWTMRFFMESESPAFDGIKFHAFTIIIDGNTHRYVLDIPLSFLFSISMQVLIIGGDEIEGLSEYLHVNEAHIVFPGIGTIDLIQKKSPSKLYEDINNNSWQIDFEQICILDAVPSCPAQDTTNSH